MPGHQRWSEANENSFESVDEFFQFPKGTAKELISMWGRGELFEGEDRSFKIPWKDLEYNDNVSSTSTDNDNVSSTSTADAASKRKRGEFYLLI